MCEALYFRARNSPTSKAVETKKVHNVKGSNKAHLHTETEM